MTQATISRWEQGRQVPSPDDVDRYARALRASATVRRQLVAMARDRHDQYRAGAPARMSVGRSAEHEQRIRRNEAQATQIGVFHPLVVPGLLQTRDYQRAIFTISGVPDAAIDAKLTQRIGRAAILSEPEREFTFILTAGALGWSVGGPSVMVTQIEHLITVSQQDHIAVGVIPWGATATAFPPCGFDIYDRSTVVVGVFGGSTYHNDPADVTRLVDMFTALEGMAVWGEDARTELRRIADDYRGLR